MSKLHSKILSRRSGHSVLVRNRVAKGLQIRTGGNKSLLANTLEQFEEAYRAGNLRLQTREERAVEVQRTISRAEDLQKRIAGTWREFTEHQASGE